MDASRAAADREKRWVATTSVLAAVGLTGMKLVVGLASGSLGILSEALHSALDLVAALVTLLAVRASSRPADREHTYGHGKVENLSALFETLLLLGTCVWIVYEAIRRLLAGAAEVEASIWTFAVVGVSIVVDVSRSRALAAAAKKYHSQALEADALHFSTDVWSSTVVLFGLAGVALAGPLGAPWLVQADALAALGVAGIVIWISIRLGRRTIDALLDAAPSDLQGRIAEAARVPGVQDVGRVRVRQAGPETFVDLTLTAAPEASFERAHDLTRQVEDAIRAELPDADVVVHIEPHEPSGAAAPSAVIQLIAARHGFVAPHSVVIDGTTASVHVELPPDAPLAEAHDEVSAFEAEVRAALPELERVVTHIEPRPTAVTEPAPADVAARVATAVNRVCAKVPGCGAPHDIDVRACGSAVDLSFHYVMTADTTVAAAHEAAERIETVLRTCVPALRRVTIHVEPPSG